jgi:hypothetical protein
VPQDREEEIKLKLMGHEYVPEDAGCLTNTSKFKASFEKFKKACEDCDAIEAGDEGGYNLDDFDNL